MLEQYRKEYRDAVHDTNRERALAIVHEALEHGIKPEDIVFHIVIPTIEYFISAVLQKTAVLSQHFIASRIAEEVVDTVLPLFEYKPQKGGMIVLGCASGDFHGLGKKIVGGCLRANMFEVIDLGVNVAPQTFIDTAIHHQAHIIGISSMMVHTALSEEGPKQVRRILQAEGLEQTIKLIVGGAPYKFNATLYKQVGADAWARDGVEAVNIIQHLLEEVWG